MMTNTHSLQTVTFEYHSRGVISFPAGLPGFENCTRFVLAEQVSIAPVVRLQSLDIPDLCFLAVPVAAIDPEYQPALLPEDLALLDAQEGDPDPLFLALLAVSNDEALTANLMAPIVVNIATGVAVQAVRADSRYSPCHVVNQGAACS